MTIEYITFCNLVLLPRLGYLFCDGSVGRATTIKITAAHLLLFGFVLELNLALISACVLVALLALVEEKAEALWNKAKSYSLISLAALILLPGYAAFYGEGFVFSVWFVYLAYHLGEAIPIFSSLDVDSISTLSLILLGLLLLANETNIGMRTIIHQLNLEPHSDKDPEKIDEQEYNAGRVIGILERWLMFLVVILSDDLSALAFIIAAKGLARMKQLDDKVFAEYMLIGTLLSALSAVLLGFYVKSLMN